MQAQYVCLLNVGGNGKKPPFLACQSFVSRIGVYQENMYQRSKNAQEEKYAKHVYYDTSVYVDHWF